MNKISLPRSEKESGFTKSEAISSSSVTESEKVNHYTAIKRILLFTIAFHICGGEPHTPVRNEVRGEVGWRCYHSHRLVNENKISKLSPTPRVSCHRVIILDLDRTILYSKKKC